MRHARSVPDKSKQFGFCAPSAKTSAKKEEPPAGTRDGLAGGSECGWSMSISFLVGGISLGRLFLPDYMPTSSLFRAIRLSGLLDHRSLLTPRCSDPSAARNPGTGGPREVPAPSSAIAAESRAPARLTPLLRIRKTASLWPWIGPAGRERTARRSMPPRKHTCPACLPGILAPPP